MLALNEALLAKDTELRSGLLEQLSKVDQDIARRLELQEASDAFTFFGLFKAMTAPQAQPIPASKIPAASAPSLPFVRALIPANTFKFAGSFDTNGILYYLGTNLGKESYEHPAKRGFVRCLRSSENTGTAEGMFGWSQSQNYTQNMPSSWAMITFVNHEVAPLHYSILHSMGNFNALRSWKLQAFHAGTGQWVDLVEHVQDTTLAHPSQPFVSRAIVDPTQRFYYSFRVLQTGVEACQSNFLMMGGFEIYGYLTHRS